MIKRFLTAITLAVALAFAAGNMQAQSVMGTSATATQATSVTTAVPIEGTSGTITTFTQTAAAGATVTFTVTNGSVLRAGQAVLLTIDGYTGTGTPIVRAGAVAAGSFTITITNIHASAALNAPITIGFAVL